MQSRRVWLPAMEGPLPAVDVLPGAATADPAEGRSTRRHDDRRSAPRADGRRTSRSCGRRSHVRSARNVLRVETAALVAVALMVDRR